MPRKHIRTTKILRFAKDQWQVQYLHVPLTIKCKYCTLYVMEVQYERYQGIKNRKETDPAAGGRNAWHFSEVI